MLCGLIGFQSTWAVEVEKQVAFFRNISTFGDFYLMN